MQKPFILSIIFLFSVLFTSCEKDKFNAFDVNVSPPYLFNCRLDRYLIDSDSIRVNGNFSIYDTITITNRVTVHAESPNVLSGIKSLNYYISSPNNISSISEGFLRDDGLSGDSLAHDGIYSASLSFKIPRVLVGLFSIRVIAIDRNDISSNEFSLGFHIQRLGIAPIISNLSAPDSVTLPPYGFSKIITMSVVVSDSNGLADIRVVYFRSLDATDSTKKYYLFDNGNIAAYGDSVAGDGIYSIKVELPFDMIAKPRRFEFQAKDFTGLLSNKILHTLYVIAP
jgi:hypothetical protein